METIEQKIVRFKDDIISELKSNKDLLIKSFSDERYVLRGDNFSACMAVSNYAVTISFSVPTELDEDIDNMKKDMLARKIYETRKELDKMEKEYESL